MLPRMSLARGEGHPLSQGGLLKDSKGKLRVLGPSRVQQRPHYSEHLSKGEGNNAGTQLGRVHEILSAKAKKSDVSIMYTAVPWRFGF